MEDRFGLIKRNKLLIICAVVITIAHILYASLSQRGAYLDGALWTLILLNKFNSGNYFVVTGVEHTRFFGNFLNQLPIAIGYFILFIKSKYWLSVLYSLPLFLFPPLALWWNYKLSERTGRYDIFVLSTFLYAVILLPFSIFAITESIIMSLLQFVLLNYLAAKINYSKKDIIVITILTVFLFNSHEYVMFLGVFLFLGSLYYAEKEENLLNKKVKYFIGLGGLFSTLYITHFIFLHSSTQGESLRFFGEATDFWSSAFELNLILSIVAVWFIIFALIKREHFKSSFIVLMFGIFASILSHMFNNLDLYLQPMWEGHIRTLPCWVVPLLFLLVILLDFIKKPISKTLCSNIFTIALLCTITQTIWQMTNTYWFNKNIEYMKKELETSAPLYFSKTGKDEIASFFNKDLRRYIWNFSYTSSSILFAPDKEINAIIMQPAESTDGGGNISFPQDLFVIDRHDFFIPVASLDIKNEFWDATKVTKELDKYNKEHGLRVSKNR